ncbi:FlgB family protein [Rhodobacter sp. KR11]|jgi:flagellar basal-body rod protein FlgB|uniref:FlgB family protein n=1 Tax=Rhodobacter sp. KR11 TaxID=2974588 RepID=UPI002222C6E2|nr:FlgB family protein [Rhodobacter sp. KR11]MCW1919190.1 FlgB family protein [Rhodobacter sp. KR11]
MLENLNITRMAGALAEHSSKRLGLVAKNVAQAATPGYKAMDLPEFSAVYQDSAAGSMRATRPGHFTSAGSVMTEVPVASSAGASPNGNTVSVEEEMVKSVMVRKDHDMALAVYSNARDILRASLGRK